jgi:hypothetical protein
VAAARDSSTEVIIHGPPGAGRVKLWIPEGIATDTGFAAVYPVGGKWTHRGRELVQEVAETQTICPGNIPLIDEHTFDAVGIRLPRDGRVRWTTKLRPKRDGVDFTVELTNTGTTTLRKAGAAVCIRFLDVPDWSTVTTFVVSEGRQCSLANFDWTPGAHESFEAWLVRGQSYGNRFYREFWSFNDRTVDAPRVVSRLSPTTDAVVSADRAYFVHCNESNPCTDLMLAFGDLAPGCTSSSTGRIRFVPARSAHK